MHMRMHIRVFICIITYTYKYINACFNHTSVIACEPAKPVLILRVTHVVGGSDVPEIFGSPRPKLSEVRSP